ncbi:hypothetical protein Tco_1387932, partial [Tanacetum coccineum]
SQSNQQVNAINPSYETYGGLHHYSESQATGGFTQGEVHAATGNYNAGANQMTKIEKAFNESPQGALPERNPRQPPIPYPSRLNKDKLQDKSDI